MSGALALALASCGSSSTTTTASGSTTEAQESTTTSSAAAETATSTATTAATEAAAASINTPGCRHVPRPASRAGEQASKATATLDPARKYVVVLATNCGPIAIELAVAQAPKTTASFAHLVQLGYYNDLTFHRIVAGFVIQGGDPNGNGSGGPSWTVVEPPPANLKYTKGVVAMAKGSGQPSGTSSSQFFIVTGANVNLPAEYALVGHVVGSEKAVEAIANVPTEAAEGGGEASKPRVPVVIEGAVLSVR